MIWAFLDKYKDFGLLILRTGIGVMFLYHGAPKITGGPEKWAGLGAAVGVLGIHFAPVFWGFMAAVSEFFGGFLLIIGLMARPAAFMMLNVMIVAASMHLSHPDQGLQAASHAIELGVVFLSLILIGPGKYSLDTRLTRG